MYQACTSPPEHKAYIGPGIKRIHKAIMEDNLCDLLSDLKCHGRSALVEAGDYAELEDAIHTYLALIPILEKMDKALDKAFNVIDNFVLEQDQ